MFNIVILGLVSLLTDISSEMVYPLLPLYLTARLGASPTIVGLIEGIAESLASLLKVFSGYISDSLGKRKPLALLGYSSSTIGKFFLYVSTSWGWVLAGRITDRFGKGIRTAPRDALIADSSMEERKGQAYGIHRALDTLGASIGIILAYYFFTSYSGDYTSVFLFSLIPAIMGIFLLFTVKERSNEPRIRRGELLLQWKGLEVRLKLFFLFTFLFTLGNSSNQFLLLRASHLGFDPSVVILLYLFYNIIYTLMSYPFGALSDKIGRKWLLVGGYIFYGLVYFSFATVENSAYLWMLFGVYGLYVASTEGVEKALVADMAPTEIRATLMGLHSTLVGIGLLPASLIAGILWDSLGVKAPFFFGGAMGCISALGLAIILRSGPLYAYQSH